MSKIPSANGAPRQPTRWTRRRIALALGAVFVAGMVAAALDLRFVDGGAPRSVEPNSLLVLDARTLETVRNTPGGRLAPQSLVARGAGLVWTVESDENRLVATAPTSRRVLRTVVVGSEPVAVAVGFGSVWVANSGNGSITRVALAGSKVETIGVADQPTAIATGSGYVWVLSRTGKKVIRVDPASTRVTKTLRLSNPPLAVAARPQDRVAISIGD